MVPGHNVGDVTEIALSGQPDDVPRARQFVRARLAGEAPDLVADVELVLTELVTNASLHGEPPISIRVTRSSGHTRVEVEDSGRAMPLQAPQRTDAMTGRGLSLVASLASAWGIRPGNGNGKVVWAELSDDRLHPDIAAALPQVDLQAVLDAWADDVPRAPTYKVRLGAVPTELLLAAKAQIDNVVRELTLLREGEASTGIALPAQLAALVRTVTVDFAEARAAIKREAAEAAARGEESTELGLDLPLSSADAAERYLAALDEADRYARSARLLTLAPPRSHQTFRRWYVRAIVEQLRAYARGELPPVPRPFSLVLVDEVDRFAHLEDVSARLALLQKLSSELARAGSAEEMAKAVVDNAAHFLGVEAARVYLLTDHGTLRSVAWFTAEGDQTSPYEEVDLGSDLPGAVVARTGRPLFMRSLNEIYDQFPALAGYFPRERSLHVVPVSAGERPLGLLGLTFVGGELADETQVGFVQSLADALAQALHRLQLAASDSGTREALTFLAGATEVMLGALQPAEVLEQLALLAVPRLGDWCTVYLAEGAVLRRVAMAIDGSPHLVRQYKDIPLSLDRDVPQTRAFLTGRPQPITGGVGHLLMDLYPGLDFSAMGGDPDAGTGLCVPIMLRGKPIGAVGMCFLGSGRRVTPAVVDAMSGLAATAAMAMDNARRWSAQHEVVRALVAALLPLRPPVIKGLELASRYLPAGGDVAGDWWEADLLPDGTALIGLGDAAGHGIDAVSMMCELRHGGRALAVVEPSPAALLADLNRRLSAPDAGFATAVYGRLRPDDGHFVWANAGHVPPLHVRPGAEVAVLDQGGSAPLGTPGPAAGRDQRLVLGPGDLLVLYSDGVVERRDRDLDEGIAALAETVAAHAGEDLEQLADILFSEHCADPVDDCCLLLVRRVWASQDCDLLNQATGSGP